jgi:hypothetical protein
MGGIATTLLFTVFETWMIADYRRLGFEPSRFPLSSMYGLMTTVNGATAITSGIASEILVSLTGSIKAPFLASTGCVAMAAAYISLTWVCVTNAKQEFFSHADFG